MRLLISILGVTALSGCMGNGTGGGGLFSGMGGPVTAPEAAVTEDVAQVAPGTNLPYGEVATVCGLSNSDMGTRIGEASGYSLYDSGGDASVGRTHYLTGFKDGCARQFTAALAMFGDLETHELMRYGAMKDLPYGEADATYERIKGEVCGVASGQPCGSKLRGFSRNATFVTVYETFGTNPEWTNILLYNGQVAAVDE